MAGDLLKKILVRLGYHSRPAFLIIGTQKAGTSALFRFLSLHPRIMPSPRKEVDFFSHDKLYARGYQWYHFQFPAPYRLGRAGVTFEATPSYLYYKKCAARIHRYDPHVKLIVLLRDPVDRAFSAWHMFPRLFSESRQNLTEIAAYADPPVGEWLQRMLSGDTYPEFEDTVRWELQEIASGNVGSEPSFLRVGFYAEQLSNLFKYFDRAQVMVIDSSQLRTDTTMILSEICEFLHLDPHDWSSERLNPVGVQQYGQSMPAKQRKKLREFYRPYNEELFGLLDRRFDW